MIDGRKVIQVTAAFAPAELFDLSRSYIKWTEGLVDEKWVLLNKYPLPSVEENEAKLIAAAEKWGYNVFDSGGDLGLQGSMNKFLAEVEQPPGTLKIGFDSDSGTDAEGWDLALAEVITADPQLFIVALSWPWHLEKHQEYVKEIAGRRVLVHPTIDMFNINIMDLDFLKKIGGYQQPVKYWGGLEGMFYPRMTPFNKKVGYLLDYPDGLKNVDLPGMKDKRYEAWKMKAYKGEYPWSFADYLEDGFE